MYDVNIKAGNLCFMYKVHIWFGGLTLIIYIRAFFDSQQNDNNESKTHLIEFVSVREFYILFGIYMYLYSTTGRNKCIIKSIFE